MRAPELLDAAHHRFGAGGVKLSSEPTGASTTGSRSLRPNWLTDASTLLTSRSTRGRNAMRVERHAVAPQRGLGFRPADDVVPVVLVEVLPRLGDELMQVVQVARRRRGVVDRGWLVGAILHDEPSG